MDKQIEAEVTKPETKPIQVPAQEYWEVWFIDPDEHVWELRDAADTQAERDEHVTILQNVGLHTRIVHYTLPALTIQAKENE